MTRWMLALLVMVSSLAAARDAGSYIYIQTPRAVDIVSLDKLEKVGSIRNWRSGPELGGGLNLTASTVS